MMTKLPFFLLFISGCNLWSMTEGAHFYGDPCIDYKTLDDSSRAMGNRVAERVCDQYIEETWYRFTGESGNQMPDKCVGYKRCGTYMPGWLAEKHPTVEEGTKRFQRVCFTYEDNCCAQQEWIEVKNCGDFYVYKLKPLQYCDMRYCGNKPAPPDQCKLVDANSRIDCGWPGVTQKACQDKGCCYDTSVNNVPWCFHPADAKCAGITPDTRIDCGFPGVTRNACEDKGCCYDESVSGVPWCFKGNF